MFKRSIPKVGRMQMSVQRTSTEQSPPKKESNQVKIVKYGGGITRYHSLAQDSVSQLPQDKDILYSVTLLDKTTIPNLRKKTLVIRQLDYIICNWSGDGFPSVFYLTSPQFNNLGYFGKDGVTDRIAALQLSQINPTLDDAQARTYDLKYTLKESVIWNLAIDLIKLNLQMKLDSQVTPIALPLPNPISLNFEIRYQLS